MAIKQKDEHFTKWVHTENGKILVRRIHRLEVQALDGRLHIVTGDRLPDMIQTCAGEGYRGAHLAQILVNPKSLRRKYIAPLAMPYPTGRDLFNVGLGFVGFIFARFFLSLLFGCL
jgi:hypothetical protein